MASPAEVHRYTFRRLMRANAVLDFLEDAERAANDDAREEATRE